jgi:hypothetical protein
MDEGGGTMKKKIKKDEKILIQGNEFIGENSIDITRMIAFGLELGALMKKYSINEIKPYYGLDYNNIIRANGIDGILIQGFSFNPFK